MVRKLDLVEFERVHTARLRSNRAWLAPRGCRVLGRSFFAVDAAKRSGTEQMLSRQVLSLWNFAGPTGPS